MPEHHTKEEILHLIREIESTPEINQRILSSKLGISLGKTNYLLKELIKKGFIKVKNFSNSPSKLKKIKYILTKNGLEHRIRLTYHFLIRKEAEFNRIKNEWEQLKTANGLKEEVTNVK